LTATAASGTIAGRLLFHQETAMAHPDAKETTLRAARALNPRPEAVSDPAFASGLPFFDARDLVQVKYEMLRRVHTDGATVTEAAAAFGFSRPSFYAAQAAWQAHGLPGLLPARPGPRGGHKLTAEIVAFLVDARARDPGTRIADLVQLVAARFDRVVHPRSIERALARQAKGGARVQP
jgi:transposase